MPPPPSTITTRMFCHEFPPIFFFLLQKPSYKRRKGFTDLRTRSYKERPIGLPSGTRRDLLCKGGPAYNIPRQITTCQSRRKPPEFKKFTKWPRTDKRCTNTRQPRSSLLINGNNNRLLATPKPDRPRLPPLSQVVRTDPGCRQCAMQQDKEGPPRYKAKLQL